MLRLIIIDDEAGTRNGLLHHIDWEGLRIGIIQTAASGQEALLICEQFSPDVILSDIRMRGMDGVETCTILHERFPDAQIIFISGYSDKEYLKAAIELGAVHYVEKPINSLELERAVCKAVKAVMEIQKQKSYQEAVQQSAEYVKREFIYSLLKCRHESDDTFFYGLATDIFDHDNSLLRVGILRTAAPVTNISRFLRDLEQHLAIQGLTDANSVVYSDFQDNRNMLILLKGNAESIGDHSSTVHAYSAAAGEIIDGMSVFLAIGDCVPKKYELYRSYESAQNSLKTLFYLGYGHTAFSETNENNIQLDADLYNSFSTALENRNEEAVARALKDIADVLCENCAVFDNVVRNIFFTLEHEISKNYARLFPECQNRSAPCSEPDFQRLESMDTVTEMIGYLLSRVREFFRVCLKEDNNSSVVMQVVRYMQQNYSDKDIAVRQMAEAVFLTPTYLSALFKRKTGKTIGEYLTAIRMEKARELLRDKHLKLYHIAERVGYEDPNYFTKSFKKQTGVTPSEYREKMW